jgi:hypothetical protein
MKMDVYTIEQGRMRQIPVDYELKQMVKYILVIILGLIIGHLFGSV